MAKNLCNLLLKICEICGYSFQPLTSLHANTYVSMRHLYICRETFTDVMSALQIGPFCSNKANFRKSQMNVNNVLTNAYEKRILGEHGKNKANSNPIQSQSNPIKANIKPKQTQYKAKQTQYLPAISVAG